MLISNGDLVRPKNFRPGLPLLSAWRVISTVGGLKLYPHNAEARGVRHRVAGLRYKSEDFNRQTLNAAGEWVDECSVPDEAVRNFLEKSTIMQELSDQPTNRAPATAVDVANSQLASAANAVNDYQRLLQDARALESSRRQALRLAKAAQAKADKEAAAKAKVVEAKRQLAARLHGDRCLADATLELIGEVSRLNNGGSESAAHASIANHADQLQPLARSYGYRIVKPSMVALVVKL